MHPMKRLAFLVLVLLLAGCGAGERWGGYTQKEAKEIIANPDVKVTIIEATPRKEGQKAGRGDLPARQHARGS